MAWSVSENMLYVAAKFLPFLEGLDPEKWRKNKEGLDYTESALKPDAVSTVNFNPFGLGIWFEMFRIFLLILLVIGLIFLVYRLVAKTQRGQRMDDDGLNLTRRPVSALSSQDALWAEYQKALKNGSYKEAVRILYQITLKKLSDKGMVHARAEKTNREYMRELGKNPLASDFTKLTSIHEFCWYADTDIGQNQFSKIEPLFMRFINLPELEN